MHVPEGSFDTWLEAAGGNNNGSTSNDRTNYYEDLPSNALELALFLESDRMGFLLDDKAPDKINGQRDVVKNEKRQSVDNQPYGQAFIELPAMRIRGAPYSWSDDSARGWILPARDSTRCRAFFRPRITCRRMHSWTSRRAIDLAGPARWLKSG